MRIITDECEHDKIWDEVERRYSFKPHIEGNEEPFIIKEAYRIYKLPFWSEEQERLVNTILENISENNIYALDWHHDCFEFNPKEHIEYELTWYDKERDCNVYFPTYYPNGDYYFFIAKDFSYALLTHPWRKVIYVVGEKLINEFEKHKLELGLKLKKG